MCPSSKRIRSDEGLTRETSALEFIYGGQFSLSTRFIKPNYLVIFYLLPRAPRLLSLEVLYKVSKLARLSYRYSHAANIAFSKVEICRQGANSYFISGDYSIAIPPEDGMLVHHSLPPPPTPTALCQIILAIHFYALTIHLYT